MRFIITISILILIHCIPAKCQDDALKQAYEGYQKGNLLEAKKHIDTAVKLDEVKDDPSAWYLRGFIYKDLYKGNSDNDSYREQAIDAFSSLMKMKDNDKYHKDALQNLKYLSTTYYNDAVTCLEMGEVDCALDNYDSFESTYPVQMDPSVSLKERNISFYLAIGSRLTSLHNADKSGTYRYFDEAITQFKKVLEYDDRNLKANYNLGVLYYNKAVNLIADLDYDNVDIIAIGELEDNSIQIFQTALPYLEKAHAIDPNDINTLEGLAGIYFSLREFDKSNELKAKVEKLSK